MTTMDHSIDASTGPTLDHSIARDLAALAADNRRGWRTADETIAGLAVGRSRPVEAKLEVLTLAALAQVFSRRVAWIAAGATGVLVMTLVLLSAFLPLSGYEFDFTIVLDRGLIPALGWVVVPMIAACALASRVAGRWFVASLQQSATPDVLGRRLVRRADGWATALLIAAVVGVVVLFGVLYFALGTFRPTPWYEAFPDETTRRTRLLPLPGALAAVLVLAAWLGRASARGSRWLGARTGGRWLLLLGSAGLVLTVGVGQRAGIWPMSPYAPSRLGAQLALTTGGTVSVLLIVVALVLGARARDEARLALAPPATSADARGLLQLQQAFVRRFAWLAAGLAALGALGLLLALVLHPTPYTIHGPWILAYPGGFTLGGIWQETTALDWLLRERDSTWACVLATVLAAYVAGGWVGGRVWSRLIGATGGTSAVEHARRLVAKVADYALAAVVAGATVAVTTYVMAARVFHHVLDGENDARVPGSQLSATTVHQVLLAATLVVVLAAMLARAWSRPSSRVAWLCHPLGLALGLALSTWACYAGSRVELFVWHFTYAPQHHRGGYVYDVPALPLLRPALIVALTLGAFLCFTWLGMVLRASASGAGRRSAT